jgi:transcriptional regulator with XRE-family HTH domain|uniref:Regulatory protein-modification, helix-turn-helix, transcriptional regulato, DNA n=1 Tax=Siphoviridae sp. ctbvd11 TaxID=2825567 RepID=A0A8S5QCV5_9CAUD|nr:MAG TPA: Regulatory protein-modification, helix-turn-helix, transcriptional regulato, DNA [Siphoviridae sp. ctbvd11]
MNIELDILRYVKEHKIPMVKVAQAAGMTPQNIKKSIGNNPKGDTITNIANGLGVHPSVFFYDKDEEKETADDSETKQNEEAVEATDKPAYPVHESGLVTENQQQTGAMIPASSMMQAETFCPHCGTRVKLGVVMIQESK